MVLQDCSSSAARKTRQHKFCRMDIEVLGSSTPRRDAPVEPRDAFTTPSPQPFSVNTRVWRPAAQRNLRNQWLKLASLRHDWVTSSAAARSHATALVNSYLSQTYMDAMDLGALSDMPGIRSKACLKLFKQQEFQSKRLLASYKDMVGIVAQMVHTSGSMRCYTKGSSSSPVSQFSCFSDNKNDSGDGGGVPVFKFWPISDFEAAAENFVQMFTLELNLKRLLVMQLSSVGDGKNPNNLCWSNEFYPGEFGDLSTCNLYRKEASMPIHPSLENLKAEVSDAKPNQQLERDALQIYLTTWIAEVNIHQSRIDEILAVTGSEMLIKLS